MTIPESRESIRSPRVRRSGADDDCLWKTGSALWDSTPDSSGIEPNTIRMVAVDQNPPRPSGFVISIGYYYAINGQHNDASDKLAHVRLGRRR